MKNKFLMLSLVFAVTTLVGCETTHSTKKCCTHMDKNPTSIKSNQDTATLFCPETGKPRGVLCKTDEWIKENLW